MAVDKLVDSAQLNADLTSVANAIRTKGGTSEQLAFPAGFVSAVQAIPTGFSVDDIAMRNIAGDIILQTATRLYNYGFAFCGITSVSSESLTQLAEACFRNCVNLERINLPNAATFSDGDAISCFQGCSSLLSVYLPKVDRVWNTMFKGCSSLKTLVLPKLYQLSRPNSVDGDTALEKIDFGGKNTSNPNSLANNWFKNCTSFNTLILRYPRLISLSGTGAFDGTPFASEGTGGTLYVPQDYISSYQSATNWSTILGYPNNQILPIEGSIYETQYADGTPIP